MKLKDTYSSSSCLRRTWVVHQALHCGAKAAFCCSSKFSQGARVLTEDPLPETHKSNAALALGHLHQHKAQDGT